MVHSEHPSAYLCYGDVPEFGQGEQSGLKFSPLLE